jgi:hypothetical protein
MYRYKGQVYDPPRRTRGRPDLQSERKGTKFGDVVLLLSIIAVKIEGSRGTNGQSGAGIPSVRFPMLAILLRTYTCVVRNSGSSG